MARYLVAFWNLENLFAPDGFANREPWIAAELGNELAGWTQQILDQKVAQLASVVAMMGNGQGPDLLGVCEVENAFALGAFRDACNSALPNRNYDIVHVDSTRDQRGIDTAFLFDSNTLRVNQNEIFSHWVMRRTGTRDITQATFITQAQGNELIAFCNHWPSRSGPGGPARSAGFRMTAAETLAYWHERVREIKGSNATIIAMGDFNDDPYDASMRLHARAWRERGDAERALSAKFYNLSWRYLTQTVDDHQGNPRVIDGTLYWDNDGNVFDQILVSRGLLKPAHPLRVVDETARIEAYPQMTDHRVGRGPRRFGRPSSNLDTTGYSDHYPVSVQIDE